MAKNDLHLTRNIGIMPTSMPERQQPLNVFCFIRV